MIGKDAFGLHSDRGVSLASRAYVIDQSSTVQELLQLILWSVCDSSHAISPQMMLPSVWDLASS
jgi:hypothetical protein